MHRRGFSKVALGLGAGAVLAPGEGRAGPPPREAQAARVLALGTNLSGMEWAESGLRYGTSALPNLNFTVPRRADVIYLARNGYTKTRLPIKWELLQPMLHDTVAAPAVIAGVGRPGAFHAGYESYITGVLDAHAAAGIKCIIDCHNYCRYRDFKFQPDGSVTGFVVPPDPLLRPYTSDNTQVQDRIFALAPGATLKQSNFVDFWTKAAAKWKNHPGFGGYGLMNEPHDMPRPGQIVESRGGEDLTIWPAYALAAIKAIRAVDGTNPIYLGGNEWSGATTLATRNPGWPVAAANIIYEVHLYLDAIGTGQVFDYDTEAAKNSGINKDTGIQRLKPAVEWARAKGVKLALTETGMPIDDPRWEEMFKRLANYARQSGCEIYSWQGGNHWPVHNGAINHVPGWHQSKTLEPAMSGPLKASAGIAQATLFDDGPGWSAGGEAVTITVYARGNLAAPVRLAISSSNGGRLGKTTVEIPAGPNGQDSFSFTPAANSVTTLTYSGAPGGIAAPPPRKVYSLSDPVAYAATSLPDAAMAIIAKYGACKWDLADGHTDYLQGAPATHGQAVRAVSDSGWGSSPGNAMQMINWVNTDSAAMGTMRPPTMRVINGKKCSDHGGSDTWGFWCRKPLGVPGVQPNPRNRVGYGMQHDHFAIAAVSVTGQDNTGAVFQASNSVEMYFSELSFSKGQPQARWTDASGAKTELTSPKRLEANTPAVVSFTSAAGSQKLRVNSTVVATGAASFAPAGFDQLLIGWGFLRYYPREGFGGNVYAVIAGKGTPSPEEMAVLERYLAR
ncbi:glycoside hydrolase family 5 protein [Caenimonas soli]|uniref:glycoside hydrolase family 5 protein n=1 Tax=Caenimonas soli TaxID=2735555 RepID=UPI00155713D9|nr:cellulase family glycosylhydrolase [Caenimonas soli]NPC54544.1 cellulase family glycosylhydrolase [Caenimonas soli]